METGLCKLFLVALVAKSVCLYRRVCVRLSVRPSGITGLSLERFS
jgi:hypothetical protein